MRALRALGVVAASLLAPVTAEAAMMQHHDLASLAYEAEAIVVADRVGEGAEGQVRYRIVRSLAGPLRPGASLTLDQGHFSTEGNGYQPLPGPLAARVLLFVKRYEGTWRIVADGLRVSFGERVYRFEQASNPGPYEPVAQGLDPDDVREPSWSGGGPNVTFAQLLSMTERAMARASEARAAIAETDPARRRARALALLAPVPGPSIAAWRSSTFYEDSIAAAVLRTLARRGDLDGTLDALARAGAHLTFAPHGLRDMPIDEYHQRMSSGPLERRIAAIRWARTLGPRRATVDLLLGLLEDPEPRIRSAAAMSLADHARTSGGPESWTERPAFARRSIGAALRARWAAETDPMARWALVHLAREWELRVPAPSHAVAVERVGAFVHYGFATTRARENLDEVSVSASVGGARTACTTEPLGGWSTSGERVGRLRYACPAGASDVRAVARLTRGRTHEDVEVALP